MILLLRCVHASAGPNKPVVDILHKLKWQLIQVMFAFVFILSLYYIFSFYCLYFLYCIVQFLILCNVLYWVVCLLFVCLVLCVFGKRCV